MKKILIINSDAFFGTEDLPRIDRNTGLFIKNLSDKLYPLGFEITLAHYLINENKSSFSDFNLRKTNVELVFFRRFKSKYFSYFNSLIWFVLNLNRFSFVYLFYPNSFSFVLFLSKLYKINYGFYIRGQKGLSGYSFKFFAENASIITSVSPFFKSYFKKSFDFSKFFTIYPMLNFNFSSSFQKPAKSKKVFNILFVGRVEVEKGIWELFDFIKMVDGNSFNFDIVGFGNQFEEFSERINSESLTHVKIHGALDNEISLHEIYSQADILILPSYHEGFPRVLYEAMFYKVAIITSMVGSIPYLMKNDYNCIGLESITGLDIYNSVLKLTSDSLFYFKIVNSAHHTLFSYLKENNVNHEDRIINYLKNGVS